jgi:DNA repair protein RadC
MEKDLLQVAEVEVSYKQNYKINERPKVNSSFDAYELFFANWNKGRISYLEEFKVMLLNRNNRVLGIVDISLGGLNGTVVDPKIIFSIALKGNASGVILCHNHPSGNLKASRQILK